MININHIHFHNKITLESINISRQKQPLLMQPQPQPQESLQPKPQKPPKLLSSIPPEYYQNQILNKSISMLPPHYNFQIQKTLYRIDTLKKQLNKQTLTISLQFPQGLMLFACMISDIIRSFTTCQTVIMGDVTYGACCVDDIASDIMDCDLLVHYGHSCLVPVTETRRKVMYVFVEISIDIEHFVDTVVYNFPDKNKMYNLLSTIQFNSSLFQAKQSLQQKGYTNLLIPQQKPRSSGQVLGCTSPKLPDNGAGNNIVIFLCDGRFHMQAVMIANPHYQFYQYDPYTRNITLEKYDNILMVNRRIEEIGRAWGNGGKKGKLCFILGTLGRQGNTGILKRLTDKVKDKFDYMIMLASQINAELLGVVEVDFFVQIACPRLSIDWSYGTPKPLLTPYELYAMMDKFDLTKGYSMDFYSYNGGEWSNFFGKAPVKKIKKTQKENPKTPLKIDSEA